MAVIAGVTNFMCCFFDKFIGGVREKREEHAPNCRLCKASFCSHKGGTCSPGFLSSRMTALSGQVTSIVVKAMAYAFVGAALFHLALCLAFFLLHTYCPYDFCLPVILLIIFVELWCVFPCVMKTLVSVALRDWLIWLTAGVFILSTCFFVIPDFFLTLSDKVVLLFCIIMVRASESPLFTQRMETALTCIIEEQYRCALGEGLLANTALNRLEGYVSDRVCRLVTDLAKLTVDATYCFAFLYLITLRPLIHYSTVDDAASLIFAAFVLMAISMVIVALMMHKDTLKPWARCALRMELVRCLIFIFFIAWLAMWLATSFTLPAQYRPSRLNLAFYAFDLTVFLAYLFPIYAAEQFVKALDSCTRKGLLTFSCVVMNEAKSAFKEAWSPGTCFENCNLKDLCCRCKKAKPRNPKHFAHNHWLLHNELNVGDIIRFPRDSCYAHFAVYIGDGDVVHKTNYEPVCRRGFWDITQDCPGTTWNLCDATPYPPDVVRDNAKKEIGREVQDSCEDFALRCRYGKGYHSLGHSVCCCH